MIKAATEGLSKKFSDLAGKIYQQQAPQATRTWAALRVQAHRAASRATL